MDNNNEVEFSEKRKFPREDLKLWVHFKTISHGKISTPLESLSENIGSGGVGLITDQELEPGQMLMLTLYLPPEESRKTVEDTLIFEENMCIPISVLAKVAWCKKVQDDEYRFGVQFVELDDYSRSLLKLYLKHYELYSENSPLF